MKEHLENQKIYRCYYNDLAQVWEPKELRNDKTHPNSKEIIDIVEESHKHPWSYDTMYNTFVQNTFYYNSLMKNRSNWNTMKPKHNSFIKKYTNPSYSCNILNIGCGYKKINKGLNLDNDVFVLDENNPGHILASMNDLWSSIPKINSNKGFDIICFLNSIHNIKKTLVY